MPYLTAPPPSMSPELAAPGWEEMRLTDVRGAMTWWLANPDRHGLRWTAGFFIAWAVARRRLECPT